MPKAKHRDRDKRGLRFPIGKRRLDPWMPVPPIGTVLELTRPLRAWWGAIGPHTLVRVVEHTAEHPGNYGPGLKVVPVDLSHPLFRVREVGDVSLYVGNREIKTHTRIP